MARVGYPRINIRHRAGNQPAPHLFNSDRICVDPGTLLAVDIEPDLRAIDAGFCHRPFQLFRALLFDDLAIAEELDLAASGASSRNSAGAESDYLTHHRDRFSRLFLCRHAGEAGWVAEPVV